MKHTYFDGGLGIGGEEFVPARCVVDWSGGLVSNAAQVASLFTFKDLDTRQEAILKVRRLAHLRIIFVHGADWRKNYCEIRPCGADLREWRWFTCTDVCKS